MVNPPAPPVVATPASSTPKCANGHENNEGASFCRVCGEGLESANMVNPPAPPVVATPASSTPKCANGHVIRGSSRFCFICGASAQEAVHEAAVVLAKKPARSKRGIVIVAGVSVLVIAAAITAFALSHRESPKTRDDPKGAVATIVTSTTTTIPLSASPQTQAASLTKLLQSAPRYRSQLESAIEAVQSSIDAGSGCQANVVVAVSEIQQVANARQTSLQQLSTTSVSSIPNGALVMHDLRSAWLISERIDVDFYEWANTEQANSCSLSDSSIANYNATNVLDPKSTAIKTVFVNLWDPIARQLNQPSSWTADQI
jgi:hypothetical protein